MRLVSEKRIRIAGLMVLYLGCMLLSYIIPNFARYNPFVLLAFTIGSMFCYPRLHSKSIVLFIICSLTMLLVDFVCDVKYTYTGITIAYFFFIIASLSRVKGITLGTRQKKYILYFCILVLSLFILGMFSHSLYGIQEDANLIDGDQRRYSGLLRASNISASVALLFLVLLWEVCKDLYGSQRKKLISILAIIFVYFVVYYLQSKTRTLLLALPYFAYQVYKISNTKYLIAFSIIALSFIVIRIDDFNFDFSKMRLGEDSSSMTRNYLYLSEIEKIKDSNILFPKGSHSMRAFVINLMADDDFTCHNDFLALFHDWGFVFILLVVAIFNYLKHNFETLVILLLYAGCALHNILFSPYVLFLLMLILIINYQYDEEKNKKMQRVVGGGQKV